MTQSTHSATSLAELEAILKHELKEGAEIIGKPRKRHRKNNVFYVAVTAKKPLH